MAIEQRSTRQLPVHGIAGGVVAGIVFILVETVMAAALGGDFFGPLRMIGSIVLGTVALSPSYPLATALIAGVVVHLILSAIYGMVFVYVLFFTNQIGANTGVLLLYGSFLGLALWIINFLIIAPIAFPQFGMANQFWMGFVAHTFFYGTVIGSYVAAARAGVLAR